MFNTNQPLTTAIINGEGYKLTFLFSNDSNTIQWYKTDRDFLPECFEVDRRNILTIIDGVVNPALFNLDSIHTIDVI